MKIRLAKDALQDDTRVAHVHHHAGLFIDNVVSARGEDAVDSSAVGHHFGIEQQPTITVVRVERGDNLFFAAHLNQFARLEVQRFERRLIQLSFDRWVQNAVARPGGEIDG